MQTLEHFHRLNDVSPARDLRLLDPVVLYDDPAAAHRALRVLGAIRECEPEAMRPVPWRLDFLEDPDWFDESLDDAIGADLLIMATNSTGALSASVKYWLTHWLEKKRGTDAAIVGLFGPEESLNEPRSPRFAFVQNVARKAGALFFAPHPRQAGSTEEIAKRQGIQTAASPPRHAPQAGPPGKASRASVAARGS